MPELMGKGSVSRGRCHDNAAAKLAKQHVLMSSVLDVIRRKCSHILGLTDSSALC